MASLNLSLAEAALRLAVRQSKEREQFGRPIHQFQAVSHKIADMATAVETARWLVYRAAWLADSGEPFTEAAAMAKLYASEAANRVASQSLQIHGGYGYMTEYQIEREVRDAISGKIYSGTSEIQRMIISGLHGI